MASHVGQKNMKNTIYLICLMIIGPSLVSASIQSRSGYQLITVVGEVHNPGNFKNDDQWNTLIRAIGESGGWKESADLERISIKRMVPESQLIRINLIHLLEDDQMQDFKLHHGDIVFVPSSSESIDSVAQPGEGGNSE